MGEDQDRILAKTPPGRGFPLLSGRSGPERFQFICSATNMQLVLCAV